MRKRWKVTVFEFCNKNGNWQRDSYAYEYKDFILNYDKNLLWHREEVRGYYVRPTRTGKFRT